MSSVRDERIERLEEELYEARNFIIESVARDYRDALTDFRKCKSLTELHKWENATISLIVESVMLVDNEYARRANCPLCGGESTDPYSTGFKLPLGLERHLRGSGNVYQCMVLKAAYRQGVHWVNNRPDWVDRLEALQQSSRSVSYIP